MLHIILGFVGVIIGAFVDKVPGAVAGLFLGVLFGEIAGLKNRLKKLEATLLAEETPMQQTERVAAEPEHEEVYVSPEPVYQEKSEPRGEESDQEIVQFELEG